MAYSLVFSGNLFEPQGRHLLKASLMHMARYLKHFIAEGEILFSIFFKYLKTCLLWRKICFVDLTDWDPGSFSVVHMQLQGAIDGDKVLWEKNVDDNLINKEKKLDLS